MRSLGEGKMTARVFFKRRISWVTYKRIRRILDQAKKDGKSLVAPLLFKENNYGGMAIK